MTHVACASKLRSVVRSSMHSCPRNLVPIGRAVVYYVRAAHAYSAGIKCRHCRKRWKKIKDLCCFLEKFFFCHFSEEQRNCFRPFTPAPSYTPPNFPHFSVMYTSVIVPDTQVMVVNIPNLHSLCFRVHQ